MIKKKQLTTYVSNTQGTGHDTERDNQPITTSVRPAPEGRGVSTLEDQRQTGGHGGVSKEDTKMDRLGADDHSRGSTRGASCACWIKNMISLPKITGIALLLFLGLVTWYLLYPYNPIQMNTLPIPVMNENNEVKQGENLFLLFDFERGQCSDPDANFYLVDGFVLEINTQAISRPEGSNKYLREIPIPNDAFVGENRHIQIEYSCRPNPIRKIYYTWITEPFNILPSESGT